MSYYYFNNGVKWQLSVNIVGSIKQEEIRLSLRSIGWKP